MLNLYAPPGIQGVTYAYNILYIYAPTLIKLVSYGLIIIKKSTKTDFEILHYTSDGNLGSLCGNGSRCAILYAYRNNIINKHTVFEAFDGVHKAEIINDELITMQMKLNSRIVENEYGVWLDTGSPHLVIETTNTDELDVKDLGRSIRYVSYTHLTLPTILLV